MGARAQYHRYNKQLRLALQALVSLVKPSTELDKAVVKEATLLLTGGIQVKATNDYKPDFTYHDKEGRGTVVGVIQGNDLVFGVALKSYQDQFSRKLGRTIATGRALKNPADVVDISGYTDGVGEVFYTKAPELLDEKKNRVLGRESASVGFGGTESSKRRFYR